LASCGATNDLYPPESDCSLVTFFYPDGIRGKADGNFP